MYVYWGGKGGGGGSRAWALSSECKTDQTQSLQQNYIYILN